MDRGADEKTCIAVLADGRRPIDSRGSGMHRLGTIVVLRRRHDLGSDHVDIEQCH
jgi:hypothetical protein